MGIRVTFALADSSATRVASEAVPWMTPPPWLSGPNRKALNIFFKKPLLPV